MNTILLKTGDLGVIKEPEEQLQIVGLGSCVAVILSDLDRRCVAMGHVALPDSNANPDLARKKPGYFADTGIPILLGSAQQARPNGPHHGMAAKLVGGADNVGLNNSFNIGKRNILAIKKMLWTHGVGVIAEDVGGNFSRTVTIDSCSEHVCISSTDGRRWKI
jgi:chemotaxis protein CheD